MMLTSGFFRLLPELPKIFWKYPVSYIVYGSWGLKVQILIDQIINFAMDYASKILFLACKNVLYCGTVGVACI